METDKKKREQWMINDIQTLPIDNDQKRKEDEIWHSGFSLPSSSYNFWSVRVSPSSSLPGYCPVDRPSVRSDKEMTLY